MILVIVVLNAVLGYVQEARAEQAVAALQRMAAATAGVVRDGREERIPTAELVPGDLLLLAEGDAVGADARLVEAASLTVAEASLTGESEPVLEARRALAGAGGPGRPGEHGLQRHGRHPRAGPRRRHGHRHGDRDGQGRPPARPHRAAGHAAPARGRPDRACARGRRDRDRDRRRRRDPPDRRARGGLGSRRRAARRRLARRGRSPRGAAGRPVRRARARRAANGQAARDREEAVLGGDAGLGVGGVLGQDGNPDPQRDDDREGRHRLGRGRDHGHGLPARR